jgi:30S ribosomal protein S31
MSKANGRLDNSGLKAVKNNLPTFAPTNQLKNNKSISMGKGDKKSRKGKIWRKSHGNTRPRKALVKKAAAKKAAPKKKSAPKKKAAAKKAPAKD